MRACGAAGQDGGKDGRGSRDCGGMASAAAAKPAEGAHSMVKPTKRTLHEGDQGFPTANLKHRADDPHT